MEIKGLGFIPLFMALWCMVWISTSYTITIIQGHTTSPLIYISDMGVFFPEQIPFCMGFIGMAIASVGLAWLNYRFILFHREAFGPRQPLIQKTLLVIAWSSCVMTIIMSLFSTTDYPMIHRIAAIATFICAGIYNMWQSILLYKVPGASRVICHVRAIFSSMALACVFLIIGTGFVVYIQLFAGECEEMIEAFVKIIEWSILVLILLTNVTFYSSMEHLLFTMSRNTCSISLRVRIDAFGV
ncbi:DNA damage-regulated autophagy modulator protein 1-like [Hyla sarda]|uniref:DNA damage-regulated autophagy modulator protein 1-like n=1 Tax=Hyla sarda TaxID=327740 RepID=UPI0024C260A3|nr:DNA damage-regulated autophagy modulator protein 1-like [Hyla sarda]